MSKDTFLRKVAKQITRSATPLHYHCKGYCSVTAKALQNHCKGVAASLQKRCSNSAKVLQ